MENKLVFICTNDMHCAVAGDESHLGLDGVAALKRSLEASYGDDNVCLVDAGDALGVGVAGCVSGGEVPLRLMEACGYAALCPGNADVSFGARHIVELAQSSILPFVCCNMRDAATGTSLFRGYVLSEVAGVAVGFVGVTTPLCHAGTEAVDFADPGRAVELDCCQDPSGAQLAAAVQDAVDAVRAEGAQVVVLLAHLGQGGEHAVFRSDAVVAATVGIDLAVDGHSHEIYLQQSPNRDGKLVPIVQGGLEFAAASVVVLDGSGGLLEMRSVTRNDVELDDNMSHEITAEMLPYEKDLSRSVCRLPVSLRVRDDDNSWLVRRVETNLGDLVADAVREAFDVDVALVPSWVLRDDLPCGEVTMGDVYRLHPLSHKVCSVRVKGTLILEALQESVSRQPSGHRYWLQVSEGLSVRFDLESRKVVEVKLGGMPLKEDAEYTLAGLDFMVAGGGSGYPTFEGCEVLSGSIPLVDAVAAYLRSLDPVDVAACYGNAVGGMGRILANS